MVLTMPQLSVERVLDETDNNYHWELCVANTDVRYNFVVDSTQPEDYVIREFAEAMRAGQEQLSNVVGHIIQMGENETTEELFNRTFGACDSFFYDLEEVIDISEREGVASLVDVLVEVGEDFLAALA